MYLFGVNKYCWHLPSIDTQFAQIDGYYDTANQIVFLHLTSTFDSWSLTNLYDDIQKQFLEKVTFLFLVTPFS